MMGERTEMQESRFYEFNLASRSVVPPASLDRPLRRLSPIGDHLRPFNSPIGRPSIDPELMIRMLIIGYCFGIRSERRLCEELHLNLPIAGSAGSASMATFPTTPPSRRPATGACVTATSHVSCSKRRSGAAWRRAWWAARALPPTRA